MEHYIWTRRSDWGSLFNDRGSACRKKEVAALELLHSLLDDDGDDQRVSEHSEDEDDWIDGQQKIDRNTTSITNRIFVIMPPSCIRLVFQLAAWRLHLAVAMLRCVLVRQSGYSSKTTEWHGSVTPPTNRYVYIRNGSSLRQLEYHAMETKGYKA